MPKATFTKNEQGEFSRLPARATTAATNATPNKSKAGVLVSKRYRCAGGHALAVQYRLGPERMHAFLPLQGAPDPGLGVPAAQLGSGVARRRADPALHEALGRGRMIAQQGLPHAVHFRQ